jgi:hypothetical protein
MEIRKSALVGYSAERIFDLIEAAGTILIFCRGARQRP